MGVITMAVAEAVGGGIMVGAEAHRAHTNVESFMIHIHT